MPEPVLIDEIPTYLAAQRWYGGDTAPKAVEVVRERRLLDERLTWMLVDADGDTYQLVLASVPADEQPDYLHGQDAHIVGLVDGDLWFDAALDTALMIDLLTDITAGAEKPLRVRPMGVEQSNTSLVFDERLVLKLFRRLHDGSNPDIEITGALVEAGFDHVARPISVWRDDPYDLAVVQDFLAGATEGWALALTSLRDLYGSDSADPSVQGGDFAAEATRLGRITADLHLSMAQAFGSSPAPTGDWAQAMRAQLGRLASDEPWFEAATEVFDGFAAADPGRAVRTHGDFHLAQVLRTDSGWYILDFEGEPARPVEDRRRPSSPLKDVAGMLRSLHYASEIALHEREEDEMAALGARAEAWERRNREAFLSGYLAADGITELLPPGDEGIAVALRAWELDKAIYELGYERSYRPDWARIPLSAIERLLAG